MKNHQMKTDANYHVTLLQKYIQTKSGLRSVSPGDCKKISLDIEEVTGKMISETTLKRFYGFARQEFKFSKYTLNTLCEYAGFDGWKQFRQTVSNKEDQLSRHTLWEEFRQKARIVTHITHKTLNNLTTIPFEFTVSRSSIETDFEFFLKSDCQLFCLIGNPGMGKTVQMLHLVEKFFLKEEAPYSNSIIWFLKRELHKELLSYNIDLAQSMDEQFSIGKKLDFLEYFHQHPHQVRGKLVLMLDGFDEYIYDSKQLYPVFQKVKDILSYSKGASWLKIVFSFRPSTWQFLQKELHQSEYLQKTWFSGLFYKKEINSNLLPLEKKDVARVIKAIHAKNHIPLIENERLYSLLSYPYYINLYYQLLKDDERRAMKSNTLYFELIASFMFKKIHHSRNGIKMMQLLNKMVEIKDFGKSDNPIEKGVLLNGDNTVAEAYEELINEGFIQEVSSNKKFDYSFYIGFVQEPLYIWVIAQALIKRAPHSSAVKLIQEVLEGYFDDEKRKMLIKCILWHKINENTIDINQVVFYSKLSSSERWELLKFVGDLLEDNFIFIEGKQRKKFIKKSNEFIISHLVELNSLDKSYDEVLKILIKYAINPVDKINLLCFLATLAILRMDKQALEEALFYLQKEDQEVLASHYPVHPLQGFKFIFKYYTKGYRDQNIRATLNNFIENMSVLPKDRLPNTEELISYQLGIFILTLCGCHREVIVLTDRIKNMYPYIFSKGSCNGMVGFILFRQAFAYLRNNRKSEAENIVSQLENYSHGSFENDSHFIQLLEILKGEIAMAEGNNEVACKYFLNSYQKCRQKKFTMFQIYTALPLIMVYKQQNNFKEILKVLQDLRKSTHHVEFPVEKVLLMKLLD